MNGHGGSRQGAGRKPGSANVKTQELSAKLMSEGLSPLEYMLQVLRDTKADAETRMEAARSAAPYVHPRLSAVDMTAKNENIHYVMSDKPMTEDEWLDQVGLVRAERSPN